MTARKLAPYVAGWCYDDGAQRCTRPSDTNCNFSGTLYPGYKCGDSNPATAANYKCAAGTTCQLDTSSATPYTYRCM